MIGRRREKAPAETRRAWQQLDQCGPKAIAAASEGLAPSAAPKPKRKSGRVLKRAGMVILRVAMVGVAVLAFVAMGFGVVHALSGGIQLGDLVRIALLLLVAAGLVTQLRGLARTVPGLRSIRLRRPAPAPPWKPLLLEQAELKAVGQAAGELPPVVIAPASRSRAAASAATWFPLAVGAAALLAFGAVGALVGLIALVADGQLLSLAGAITAGVFGMLGFALWGTGNMVVRSLDQERLRRRKRALRQLLRALLRWLGGGTKASRQTAQGIISGPQVLGLCALAFVAVAAGLGPALVGGDSEGEALAASAESVDEDQGGTPGAARQGGAVTTPTPTQAARAGGATPEPNPSATAGSNGSGSGGGAGAGAGSSTATGTVQAGAGTVGGTATATPTGTRTPTATNTTTISPNSTATGTSTAPPTPTGTPTGTATPTPFSAPPPTSIPPSPTTVPPSPTPIPPTSTPVQLQISSLQYCWVGTTDLRFKVSVSGTLGESLSGTASYHNPPHTNFNMSGSTITVTMFGNPYVANQTLTVSVKSATRTAPPFSVSVGSPASNQC